MNNSVRIRVIEPAGCSLADQLSANIDRLRSAGFDVLHDQVDRDDNYPLYAAADEVRARCLTEALLETQSDVVLAARGGYGASSLLRLIDWSAINNAPAKLLIGFSDICAVHSAIFTRLNRVGLHGAMPGSGLFSEQQNDNKVLLSLLAKPMPWQSQLKLNSVNCDTTESIEGWLFGGNLAVLSSLIGTPWFPASLSGSILFIEDVNVNAGSVGRDFDQWIESGSSNGLQAIVIGAFTKSGKGRAGQRQTIIAELARRADCPVFETELFGHCAPNLPIPIGARAQINTNGEDDTYELCWQLDGLVGAN